MEPSGTTFEQALANMRETVDWGAEHGAELDRNEATTRLQLIDRLLRECLAWPSEQTEAEHHEAGEYADYLLGVPVRRVLIEAKREGRYFDLPVDTPRIAKLTTLFAANKELACAIEQALPYAQRRGVPFAAVCNGRQLTAFLPSRTDGVSPMEGRALAFSSLSDMLENFALLWDNLSLAGTEARTLQATLGGDRALPPPPKLSARVAGYPGHQPRNDLATQLQILGELFLHDLIRDEGRDEEEFLRECYCPSGALSQYALVTRALLAARYSAALGETLEVTLEDATTGKGNKQALRNDILAASMSTRPIILLGYVGVGKTMFIRHLIKVDAQDIADNAIVLYLDLLSEPALSELEEFIHRHFVRQLYEDHGVDIEERNFVRGVYNLELERFRAGVWSDIRESAPDKFKVREIEFLDEKVSAKEAHLRQSLDHLVNARQQQVIVILDNVDQRPSEFQERVFGISHSLAASWPGTVFVSLRPDTFNRSRKTGSLTAYQPRVFTIPPPRVDRVVEKRIAYGRRQIEEHGRLPSFPEGMTVQAESLNSYLDILATSFRKSDRLMRLLDNISAGNVRRALEHITTFVTSGHTNPARALRYHEEQGGYVIPFHEFCLAILLGETRYYDPGSSRIPNVFDICSPDGREHFLLPLVLDILVRTTDPDRDEGYVSPDAVYGPMQDLGFSSLQVAFAIERARSGELIETLPFEGVPRLYRITTVGTYVLQCLVGEFTYVDVVIIDTPIVAPAVRAEIQDVHATTRRVQRCRLFCDYLDSQWTPLSACGLSLDWPGLSGGLRQQMEGIEERLGPTAS